ncbi:hypothetical protein TwortDSMZ_143 [Staphylococcus phage Twort]|uniref:ORF139 n=2 Tax=Staphylococcus phage Twort (strain DSM 17442 / HER 48) TaxID=2908167 RepID=Q4Z9A2_BPTWO|nr:ORF139 [Staphylococcus phage Twort]AAX92425.1 ORF139 [Staphylococcus phage Twort]QIW89142.1 hypothetical protein TwortDSMZ_143 [Staphylococcus phage Twort]
MERLDRDKALEILNKTSIVLQNQEDFNVSEVRDVYGAKCVTIGYDTEDYFLIYDNNKLTLNSKPNDSGFDNTVTVNSFEDILNTIGEED